MFLKNLVLIMKSTSSSSHFGRALDDENFPSLSYPSTVLFNLSSSSSFPNQSNFSSTSLDISPTFDSYQILTDIVYKYICLAIFVIGVIGNLLSVLVFSRPSLRHRSCAIYFLALAITDIASLCASFIDTVLPSYNHVTLTAKSLFICKLNPLMVYFTSDLSNFLLCVASIDRAVSIQCPLRAKRFCRARIAITIIIAMSMIFLLINGHIFWGFEIIEVQPSLHVCMPANKTVYQRRNYRLSYMRFYEIFDSLDMLFAVVIPFIVMLICNIIILVRVVTSRRSIRSIITTTMQSKKLRKRHEKEKQLTVMLLGSAAGEFLLSISINSLFFFVAFLVFTLPTEINDTVRAFRPSNGSQTKGAMALITAIFIAMGQLNHAIHFYIYTLTGAVFRNELIQLFTWTKNKSSSYRATTTTEQTFLQAKVNKNNDQRIDMHGF